MLLRKFILAGMLAGAAVGFLMGPAAAQMPMPGMKMNNAPKVKTPDELAKERAIDEAYKAANKKIPDKVANDPWGNIRSAPTTTGSGQQ
jgi:hypothetical protein